MVCYSWTEKCNELTKEEINSCVCNGEGVGCLAIAIKKAKEKD
tara:strand:- start:1684 stop:1812 length:129 start_codon:yes stop_codon:yes gene_type:complete